MMRARLLPAAIAFAVLGPATSASAFDIDNDWILFEMVPLLIPPIYEISPGGGDATLVLRTTGMFTNSWFDATSAYHPTSIGVVTDVGRRPASEHTQRNWNITVAYASYRVAQAVFPHHEQEWRDFMLYVGLDPDDDTLDLTTPAGIGNNAGLGVVEYYETDGMNMLGDGNGRGEYHRRPYEDTTGYAPINTAYELKHPSRWQPAMVNKNGLYTIQQFVTPQYAYSKAFSYDDVNQFPVPEPIDSRYDGPNGRYRAQADAVLAAQVNLTDEQKMLAELFDNKLNSLGQSTGVQAFIRGLNMRQFIEVDMINHVAALDVGHAVWKAKWQYDAVRPFSAIRKLYAGQKITAWGGPGKGIVNDLPGEHWDSYMAVADHPEYPSASTAFCHAHAQSMRVYFGDDFFGWPVVFPAGSSLREPGVTPATDVVHVFNTWTEFQNTCGAARVWGGVHFPAAIEASKPLGLEVGQRAAEFVMAHINGTIGQ